MFLFEVFEQGNYVFQGQVDLAERPYAEQQPDTNGHLRSVWIFPLKLVDTTHKVPLPENLVKRKQEKKEREASKLSVTELARRAKFSKKGIGSRQITSIAFERNVYVAELAKRRAQGICQLCGNQAPFTDKKKNPFLESHHIVWLSKGGEDTINNTVALCPNCDRRMHVLNLKADIQLLKKNIHSRTE